LYFILRVEVIEIQISLKFIKDLEKQRFSYFLIEFGPKSRPGPAGPFFPSPHCFLAEPSSGLANILLLFFAQLSKGPSPRTTGPTRPSLHFLSHGPGEAQWPAPDEPLSSSPCRSHRRTRAAHPRVNKSSLNRIKMNPRSNPTSLRDRVPAAHDKEPKSPINRVASRQIFAQIRAQTLEASVVPSSHRCKPSPLESMPCQPSTTSTAPLEQSLTMSSPWSLLLPSPKAKA
jgi:hypothetical protein